MSFFFDYFGFVFVLYCMVDSKILGFIGEC